MSVGNAKVGIFDPETGEDAIITDGALHVYLDTPVSVDVDMATEGIATELTLAKLVGFDENSNITASVVTVGAVKTITETDGVKTLTTVVTSTDPNNISITETWT
jgi:hypothetical protein